MASVKIIVTGNDWNASDDKLTEMLGKVVVTKASNTFVIATAVNHGFLHHLYNFDCYMRRLNLPYVVFSLDSLAAASLEQKANVINSFHLQIPGEKDASVNASEFRSLDFNIITARKIYAVHQLLLRGLDVLFLDVDVTLLREPFEYLLWKNVHYVHSLNYNCDST